MTAGVKTEIRLKKTGTWGPTNKHEAVLLVEGVPVVWANVMTLPDFDPYICLCDIEVREGYTGLGYARELTRLTVKDYGKPLATTGRFTELGFRAFGGKLPIVPSAVYANVVTNRPTQKPMKYINDWDSLDF